MIVSSGFIENIQWVKMEEKLLFSADDIAKRFGYHVYKGKCPALYSWCGIGTVRADILSGKKYFTEADFKQFLTRVGKKWFKPQEVVKVQQIIKQVKSEIKGKVEQEVKPKRTHSGIQHKVVSVEHLPENKLKITFDNGIVRKASRFIVEAPTDLVCSLTGDKIAKGEHVIRHFFKTRSYGTYYFKIDVQVSDKQKGKDDEPVSWFKRLFKW